MAVSTWDAVLGRGADVPADGVRSLGDRLSSGHSCSKRMPPLRPRRILLAVGGLPTLGRFLVRRVVGAAMVASDERRDLVRDAD